MNVIILPRTPAGREVLRHFLETMRHRAFNTKHPGCIYGVDFDKLARDVEQDERAFAEMDREFERYEASRQLAENST